MTANKHIKASGLQDVPLKITPTMRRWCARLLNPQLCELLLSTEHRTYGVMGPANCGRPSVEVVIQLIAADLIEFKESGRFKVAVLTEAGRKAAEG